MLDGTRGHPGDGDVIGRMVQSQAEAWCRGDAEGYAANAEADLGFTNILGARFVGREAFVKVHERILSGIYQGSRLTLDIEHLRILGPDVAVVELAVRLEGAKSAPPGIHLDADGTLRTRLLEVFERRAGSWVLVVNHNTAVLGAR